MLVQGQSSDGSADNNVKDLSHNDCDIDRTEEYVPQFPKANTAQCLKISVKSMKERYSRLQEKLINLQIDENTGRNNQFLYGNSNTRFEEIGRMELDNPKLVKESGEDEIRRKTPPIKYSSLESSSEEHGTSTLVLGPSLESDTVIDQKQIDDLLSDENRSFEVVSLEALTRVQENMTKVLSCLRQQNRLLRSLRPAILSAAKQASPESCESKSLGKIGKTFPFQKGCPLSNDYSDYSVGQLDALVEEVEIGEAKAKVDWTQEKINENSLNHSENASFHASPRTRSVGTSPDFSASFDSLEGGPWKTPQGIEGEISPLDVRICPMCNSQFDYEFNEDQFEAHVISHFEQNINDDFQSFS